MIPSDWEVCQLKHECSLITKGTTPSSLGFFFAATGINFLKIEAIEKSGKLIKENLAYIDEITNRALFRSQLQENDLLVSIAGALGRLFIVDASVLPANTNQALAIIRLKKNTLFNHRYLFYYLSSDPIQNLIKDLSVTGAQPNISLENVRNFLIGFPVSPKEQQRIANALSDVDTLIANLEKLIAKKKNIKQGAMQQLLTGKKRLPGFGPATPIYKQTELGIIPTDWEVKPLKKIGVFSKGAGISRDESNSGNIPAVRYGEIYTKHNDYIKKFYSHISQDVADKSVKMQKGDLLFSASGETKEDIGKTIAFVDDFDAYAGGDIIIFTPTETIDSIYMGYLLNFPSIAKQKAMKAQGDAVVHITTDSLKKLAVCLPSPQEQTAIANTLSDMDTEIATLETKLAKYRKLKTGMMQQLLTGKIRLV